MIDLADRLDRLERSNRRLKGVVVLVVFAGVVLVARDQVFRNATIQLLDGDGTIEAREFVVRDNDGKRRASLGVPGDMPALVLFDESENGLASLSVQGGRDGASHLTLCDRRGKAAIYLGLLSTGPTISLSDASGKIRASLAVDELRDGSPSLILLDANEMVRASLAANRILDGSPSLTLNDAKEEPIWSAPTK